MQNQFGIGIVGAGIIAEVHALAIKAIANAKLIGVYNLNRNKADAFAVRHGCIAFDDLHALTNNQHIQLVCICTPSGVHYEPAIECIEAGKHCLIEKPLEVTLERCDRLIEYADKAGVTMGVIFPSRFYPASQRLKRAIDAQRFGDLVLGDAYVKWQRNEAYYASAAWRGTWKLDGGGALMNQGIHSVDLLQWYMGPVESVQAVSANVRHKSIEVEDTIVSTIRFKNGALGTIECSTAVFPGSLKRVEIRGTRGTAVMEESNLIEWQFETPADEDAEIARETHEADVAKGGVANPADISFVGHQKQIEDMIDAVQTGRRPLVDDIEGRKAVEIVLAIYESARSGRRLTL